MDAETQVQTDATEQPVQTPETETQNTDTGVAMTPEIEKLVQSLSDRAVTKALETQRKRLERETEERLLAEKKAHEEARLAEQGKYKELAEAREAELSAMRAEAAAKELKAKTVSILADRNLHELQPIFDADLSTIEGRTTAIEAMQKAVEDAVEARVNERLRTPGAPRGAVKSIATGSLSEQLIAAQRAGDWTRVAAVNNQIMEARHRQLTG